MFIITSDRRSYIPIGVVVRKGHYGKSGMVFIKDEPDKYFDTHQEAVDYVRAQQLKTENKPDTQ